MMTISGMTTAFGAHVLFEDASLQVNRGDRIGLVGPNGAGQSTLFSNVSLLLPANVRYNQRFLRPVRGKT
jgi:ATPase subunit of ABC transporter with duplicated ATPase domains